MILIDAQVIRLVLPNDNTLFASVLPLMLKAMHNKINILHNIGPYDTQQ